MSWARARRRRTVRVVAHPANALTIIDANEAHDEAIERIASSAGLSVSAAQHRARAGAVSLVALGSASEVLGFVTARALLDEMEIFDLCVDEAERRRGIGRALLSTLLQRARAAEIAEVFLEVRVGNSAARALYQGLGFSEIGTRERYYSDGEDAALFRCCLAPSP